MAQPGSCLARRSRADRLAQPGPNGPGRDGPPDQAAPPGCRLSGIGRVNVVTNVRGGWTRARAPDRITVMMAPPGGERML